MRQIQIYLLVLAIFSAPFSRASLLFAERGHERATPALYCEPTVKILLERASKGGVVEVAGRYILVDPKNGNRLTSGLFGKRWQLRPSKEGIVGSDIPQGIFQVQLIPRRKDRLFWLDGTQYSGTLCLYQIAEKFNWVNEIAIEAYVAAIVQNFCGGTKQGELSQTEFARALAICARTQAAYCLQNPNSAYWHLYAPEFGFKGVGGFTEENIGGLAARATKGLVLVHSKNGVHSKNEAKQQQEELFSCRWTAHCAGATLVEERVGQERDSKEIVRVESPLARLDRPRVQWQKTVLQEQIEKAFDLKRGSLKGLSLSKDPETQKVIAVTLETKEGPRSLSYSRWAQGLGSEWVQSSDFSVVAKGSQQFSLHGFGQGDGFGLCLYTAEKMAEEGQLAPEILQFFFPGSKVERRQK